MKKGEKDNFVFFGLENKRGLSAVVITLIMILLALVVAGTIWVVVTNIVEEGSEDISLSGVTIDLEIKSATVDTDSEALGVSVERKPGEGDLTGINILIADAESNQDAIREDVTMDPYETRSFTISASELSQVGLASVTEVSVAPIYNTEEGSEQIGNVVDTYTVSEGSVSGGGDDGSGDEGGDGGGDLTGEGESCMSNADCGSGLKCDTETSTCVALCDGTWEQDYYNETVYECDGLDPETVPNCNLNSCLCDDGFDPNEIGGCTLGDAENSGTIATVWPEQNAALFFNSLNLSQDSGTYGNYVGMYVWFPASGETSCIYIAGSGFSDGVSMTYLELFPEANITDGESYEIRQSSAACDAAAGI